MIKYHRLNHSHRNLFQLILRGFRLLSRYGFSARKMEFKLDQYLEILHQYDITPTIPITGVILKRHPQIAQKLSKNGVELAGHGYKHIDYTKLSDDEISEHFIHIGEAFRKNNISLSGFRFPYLKHDRICFQGLRNSHFKWDSSSTVYWDVVKDIKIERKKYRNYENMLKQYSYKDSVTYMSLPRFVDNILEIPVSLPDDDLLERGNMEDNNLATKVWGEILRQTHSRGELFSLQVHPERIHIFKEALEKILENSRQLSPKVWTANLGSIYDWWEEKKSFSAGLNFKSNGEYEVDLKCSPRATVLVRSHHLGNDQFYKGSSLMKERKFLIKSDRCPTIGIPKDSSVQLIQFLKNEGFIFELSEMKEKYSIYLDTFGKFSEEDEMRALEIIHKSKSPLIRFWRWPNECKSALCITGDIDALTSFDFLGRLFC